MAPRSSRGRTNCQLKQKPPGGRRREDISAGGECGLWSLPDPILGRALPLRDATRCPLVCATLKWSWAGCWEVRQDYACEALKHGEGTGA